jgi:hypothetical protein
MFYVFHPGMRGAWGKPYGTVARINIGQIILFISRKRWGHPGGSLSYTVQVPRLGGWGFTDVAVRTKEENRILHWWVTFYAVIWDILN